MNKIEMAKQLLTKTRDESDVNLVDEVVNLLRKHNFTEEQINVFFNNRLVQNCCNNVFEVQRVNVNRFWTIELMKLGAKSIEARNFLLQDGTINDWLLYFEKTLTLMKENNIPRVN